MLKVMFHCQQVTTTAEGVEINNLKKNLRFTNGVVHEIMGFMTPPRGNLADVISHNSNLSEFNNWLDESKIMDTIRG